MPALTRHHLKLWLRWSLFGVGMVLFATLYVGKALHAPPKVDWTLEEKRHLKLTEQSIVDLQPEFTRSFSEPMKRMMPHRTDGLTQPLWPWVAAWMHDSADLTVFRKRTQFFQLGLTLAFLILLGITCARSFSLPAALVIVLIAGLHGFLPTLSWFTGTSLFQVFFLLSWVTCLHALERNSLWVYGLSGVFGALAYLSEDRILPLLVIFVLISTIRATWGWLKAHWTTHDGTSQWLCRNHLFGLILFASCFGFIAGSRMVEARANFGQGFFSYIDHVRWLEDEPSAQTWIRKHPNATSLKSLPLEERANLQIYMGTHTQQEAWDRLQMGLQKLWQRYSLDGGWHIVGLLIVLILLLTITWYGTPRASHAGQKLHPETMTMVFFTIMVSLTMLLIAAWDSTVWPSDHSRTLLSPLALSLVWSNESVLRRAQRRTSAKLITYAYLTVLWSIVSLDFVLHGKTFLNP
jgi:hypothetical protein